jgi:hypothetical protein
MLLSHLFVSDAKPVQAYISRPNRLRLCVILRRPTLLRYDEYIEQCSQLLARVRYVESDHLLHCYIQLQKISEEASHAFECESKCFLPQVDAVRLCMLARSFDQEITQLLTSASSDIRDNGEIFWPVNLALN